MLFVKDLKDAYPIRSLVSVPEKFVPSGGLLPVLFFLHGSGEKEPLEIHDAMRRHGPLKPTSSHWATEDFIVVAPQLPEDQGGDLWYTRAHDLEMILKLVAENYHGDLRRAYLTGFSYGANGVLEIGSAKPNLWAALWPVDPSRMVNANANLPIWLWFGAFQREANRANAESRRLKKEDEKAAFETNRRYTQLDANHVGTARSAYQQNRPYEWLLSLSREKE